MGHQPRQAQPKVQTPSRKRRKEPQRERKDLTGRHHHKLLSGHTAARVYLCNKILFASAGGAEEIKGKPAASSSFDVPQTKATWRNTGNGALQVKTASEKGGTPAGADLPMGNHGRPYGGTAVARREEGGGPSRGWGGGRGGGLPVRMDHFLCHSLCHLLFLLLGGCGKQYNGTPRITIRVSIA